jgi:hypothetical protein
MKSLEHGLFYAITTLYMHIHEQRPHVVDHLGIIMQERVPLHNNMISQTNNIKYLIVYLLETTTHLFLTGLCVFLFQAAELYLGYLVCLGIGVVLLLVVTFGGLIYCCCQCCCRKKGSRVEKKGDKYKRISCGIILAFFNTLIL